jgi:hypothetical protein
MRMSPGASGTSATAADGREMFTGTFASSSL